MLRIFAPRVARVVCLPVALLLLAAAARADHDETKSEGATPGHSTHGEAFNEGPRQGARLIAGTGKVHFHVTTKAPEAQAFFNQGIGQLHGFWYFEAERSFRQVALLDPDCAMAYWGIAMANTNNDKRAKPLIAEAVKRKAGVTPRETAYIDALNAYLAADPAKKKERAEAYTKALERILYDHPDDLEAKAFLALQLWKNKSAGVPIASHLAIDALLGEIFAREPLHPAHHYRIHLWDGQRGAKALTSAARCGQAAPGIAHMWHMSGHTFSELRRYADAAWQQEASGRVDHAYMIADRILPDQIHNYAHNQEWLVRDLMHIGRVHDAVAIAKNLCELPRHPKFNTLKRGSASYGRQRLAEVLERYELWDSLSALSHATHLGPVDDEKERVQRLRRLGAAEFRRGEREAGERALTELEELLTKVRHEADEAAKKAEQKAPAKPKGADEASKEAEVAAEKQPEGKSEEKPAAKTDDKQEKKEPAKKVDPKKAAEEARKPFAERIATLEKACDQLRGHRAVADGDWKRGLELIRKAGTLDKLALARLQVASGEKDEIEKALKEVRAEADRRRAEVLPLATLVDLLHSAGKIDEAKKEFARLRPLAVWSDLDVPPLARLAPVADAAGMTGDWRPERKWGSDVGERPSLDTLGPMLWSPPQAPSFSLTDAAGKKHESGEFRGRGVVMIFFLGSGCLHCAEQLQKFAPLAAEFEQAGLTLVAVSTDDQEGLQQSIDAYTGGKLPLLLSDDKLAVFKAFRAYDDFEKQPLHGTFVLDAPGRLRWHDTGHEPFMDAQFVLDEARRLLQLE